MWYLLRVIGQSNLRHGDETLLTEEWHTTIKFIVRTTEVLFAWTVVVDISTNWEEVFSLIVCMGCTGFWNVNCQQQQLFLGYQIRFHPGSGWNVQCRAFTCFTSCIVLSEVIILEVRKRSKRALKASCSCVHISQFLVSQTKALQILTILIWGND